MCSRWRRRRGGSSVSVELGEPFFSFQSVLVVKTSPLTILLSSSSRFQGCDLGPLCSSCRLPRCVPLFFVGFVAGRLDSSARRSMANLPHLVSFDASAESLARRKAREEKVNSQDMFRLPAVPNEDGSFQVAARSPDKTSRFPTTSVRSFSDSPAPRSTSNGNGNGQLAPPALPSHPSHQQAALPHHMQSPSQNPLAYGSPQNSAPSPYQPNFSPSSQGDPLNGPTPPDFFQVGGGSFLGVFPDFFAAENDPAMVSHVAYFSNLHLETFADPFVSFVQSLFPSSQSGDYFIADDFFATPNASGSVGGSGDGGGLVDHSGGGSGGGDGTGEWGSS